jgi:hypothetical protein
MRLSMISRIIKAEVCVICRRLRWISGVLAGGPEGHAPPPSENVLGGAEAEMGCRNCTKSSKAHTKASVRIGIFQIRRPMREK